MIKETPYGDALIEIENGLWEHDRRMNEGVADPYSYDDAHFKASLKIFLGPLLWKLWEKTEGGEIEERARLVEELGNRLREIILEFTGVDTHKLYRE